ncbi:MAG: hypothetical protein LIO92_11075 [Clostridiales bacterium]|nr:hypothetical protein [Clostridiales bacterium]
MKKVNENILVDDDVYVVQNGDIAVLVIHVPRADYTARPIYKGENPYKGTFKRNHEGDYHAKEYEVRAMIRDQSTEGNDGTWENNLFNFFMKVSPKLTGDLKKPFVLKNMQREDDTPLHKAIREAFVNLIIHSDYRMDAGVLKIVKKDDGFVFTNPGSLKLPKEQIYRGGNSKARNPRMQAMLRFVGFGDNAGSGFPDILRVWKDNGWPQPELEEDIVMNQVTLTLKISAAEMRSELSDGGEIGR